MYVGVTWELLLCSFELNTVHGCSRFPSLILPSYPKASLACYLLLLILITHTHTHIYPWDFQSYSFPAPTFSRPYSNIYKFIIIIIIIMESTDLHQHHHQLQQDQPPTLEPSSLSTITTPSSFFHGGGSGTNHSWTPNIILNSAGGNNNPRSRADLTDNNDVIGAPPIQDFGYHHHQHHQWTTTTSDDAPQSCLTATSKLLTKEEIINLPKFSCEMLSIPSTIEAYAGLVTTTNHMNNNDNGDDDLNEKLLLKNLLSGGDFYSRTNNNYYYYYPPPHGEPRRGGNFSQIYPSINISNNYSTAALALVSSPMEESLDLLTTSSSPSTSFTANTTAAALTRQHLASVTFPDNPSFRLDHMQHHHHTVDMSSCTTTSNNSASSSHLLPNGTAEAVAKRPCSSTSTSSMELESSSSLKASQTPSKKSRSESRPSPSPPFKVRKEKLGDRIAALQQLVAPFGKTDTASVLMEAIGYIKFLQSQVETLSVPYMKSSQNQSKRVKQGGSGCMGGVGKDLGSRGLCLVPLSCMSYIAGDAATDVWQHHPNFGGPT